MIDERIEAELVRADMGALVSRPACSYCGNVISCGHGGLPGSDIPLTPAARLARWRGKRREAPPSTTYSFERGAEHTTRPDSGAGRAIAPTMDLQPGEARRTENRT